MTNQTGEESVDVELREEKKRIGLRGRWDQVHQTLLGKNGHSGAKKMRQEYGLIDVNQFPDKGGSNRLFVSCFACAPDVVKPGANSISELSNPEYFRLRGIVAYLEQEAMAQYATNVSRNFLPKFNSR